MYGRVTADDGATCSATMGVHPASFWLDADDGDEHMAGLATQAPLAAYPAPPADLPEPRAGVTGIATDPIRNQPVHECFWSRSAAPVPEEDHLHCRFAAWPVRRKSGYVSRSKQARLTDVAAEPTASMGRVVRHPAHSLVRCRGGSIRQPTAMAGSHGRSSRARQQEPQRHGGVCPFARTVGYGMVSN